MFETSNGSVRSRWMMALLLWTTACRRLRICASSSPLVVPILPFCRRGHGQAVAVYVDRKTGEKRQGVFVFGGYSTMNYADPGSEFLQDLWLIDVWDTTNNNTAAGSSSSSSSGYAHSFKRISLQPTAEVAARSQSLRQKLQPQPQAAPVAEAAAAAPAAVPTRQATIRQRQALVPALALAVALALAPRQPPVAAITETA